MRVQKGYVITTQLVHEDGSALDPATAAIVRRMVAGLWADAVLGKGSPVNDSAAMRIAASILARFEIVDRIPEVTDSDTD